MAVIQIGNSTLIRQIGSDSARLQKTYIIESAGDIANLPTSDCMGSIAYNASDGTSYYLASDYTWQVLN